ncbi:MAG: glutamate 5-kinase, partial [Rhizomicrobium sp.]
NDTVATAEIRFGDNDRLAARVTSMMEADCLVLLSDVDGLYSADPTRNPTAQHIAEVARVSPEIEAMAGGSTSGLGRGGMNSKVLAAKIATVAGAEVLIAKGNDANPLAAIRSGVRHTRFVAGGTPAAARKRWIAGGLKIEGALVIDAGAARALEDGKSLLPAGVRAVEGNFDRGDAVVVRDMDGRELARGLVAYHAADAQRIAGRRSAEIETILGYRGRDEMIHRDDLALTTERSIQK